jgi:hypothetical protein
MIVALGLDPRAFRRPAWGPRVKPEDDVVYLTQTLCFLCHASSESFGYSS